MNIMAGGILKMTDDVPYQLVVKNNLFIAPSGSIQATRLTVDTNSAVIEEGGVIDLNSRGYFKSGPGIPFYLCWYFSVVFESFGF